MMRIQKTTLMNLAVIAAAVLALGNSAWSQQSNPTDAQVASAVKQAVELLLHNQERYVPDPPLRRLKDADLEPWQKKELKRLEEVRKNSSQGREWPYEGVYRVRPDRRIPPGYRVGGTALVCDALLAAPGMKKGDARQGAVSRAVGLMLELLETDEKMSAGPKRGYDVRGWGHAYALGLFADVLKRGYPLEPKIKKRVEAMIPHLLKCLKTNETKQGGWNYAGARPSSFMTSSTVLTLYRVESSGFDVDDAMIDRALDALEKGRSDNGAFGYSGRRKEPMPASCARSASAELALFLAGRSSHKRLRVAIDGFFTHWDELKKRKSKQGTHLPPYSIAPYYFFFGHTYVAMAIEYLPEKDRPALRKSLREVIWRTRESNGGWNDRIFPRTESYSTAMVILALLAPDQKALPMRPGKR